jgi:AraC family transcriptional regulator, regulatory protein of adaptative response / methylated-DNA-[protein]-cysteine methyltransferase
MNSEPTIRSNLDGVRWDAVIRRDPSFDGSFFYSVRTTGVFCRSRLPRRENVSFHDDIAAAVEAGFRACKRCRPDERPPEDVQAAAVAQACRLIESSEQTPSLDELAGAAGLSRYHFHRVFKKVTGVTPGRYAAAVRASAARRELVGAGTVTEAIYAAGFNASSRFYESAADRLGMRPGAFRAGGTGEVIRFAVGTCSLGHVLVAATDVGVCAILLGDDPEELVRDLQDRFPQAELIGGDPGFEEVVAHAVGAVERPHQPFPLPLDIRGTAFQEKVWGVLRSLKPGATASYADVAAAIGRPEATRAVAQACGANRIAIAIPCHRVVRTDGGLSGYRWGIERKRALLEREQEGEIACGGGQVSL